jgi:hypothetical protein
MGEKDDPLPVLPRGEGEVAVGGLGGEIGGGIADLGQRAGFGHDPSPLSISGARILEEGSSEEYRKIQVSQKAPYDI